MAAKRLWLLRHGEAVPHGAKPDFERDLTALGREQSIAAGKELAAREIALAACLTSPLVRAVRTADLACEALDLVPEQRAEVGKGFDASIALDLLSEQPDDAAILVVGHNPAFAQVVYDLTGEQIEFKKGALIGLLVEGKRAEFI